MPPVEILVRAIVRVAATQSHYGHVYNIVQNDTIRARTVFNLLLDMRCISEYVPVDEWKSRLNAQAEKTGDYVLSVLAQSLDDIESYLNNHSKFDCSGFETALSDYGLRCPPIHAAYLKKGVRR